jgi:hypothetical protein
MKNVKIFYWIRGKESPEYCVIPNTNFPDSICRFFFSVGIPLTEIVKVEIYPNA